MFKKSQTTLLLALTMCSVSTFAANYNIIIYNKDKVNAPAYTISLQDYVFPSFRPGVAQSFDISTLASVLGDPGYNASNLTWGTQNLPAGFSIVDNVLKGTASATGTTPFMLTANYKGVNTTKQYQFQIAGVPALGDIVSSSFGYAYGCAITGNGNLYCWGFNSANRALGIGSINNNFKTATPMQIATGEPMKQVSTSYTYTSCAVSQLGSVFCWGNNANGQTTGDALASPSTKESPTRIPGISTATHIGISDTHGCAVLSSGGLACWGKNTNGQFGNGATSWSEAAATNMNTSMFGADESAVEVAVADVSTCVRTNKGRVLCTGGGTAGATGQGHTSSISTLSEVIGMNNGVTKLMGGYYKYCAIKTGSLYCWGHSVSISGGNLVINNATPVLQDGLTNVTAVGIFHTGTFCAVANGGNAYCWGNNSSGNKHFPASPTAVPAPGNVLASNVGANFKFPTFVGGPAICFLPNGNLKCGIDPGTNSLGTRGMLGDGTYTDKSITNAEFVIAP